MPRLALLSMGMAALLLGLMPAGRAADWNYLQAQLVRGGEVDPPGGDTINANGMDLAASIGFGDHLFFQAGQEANNLDLGVMGADIGYDRFYIGPGAAVDLRLGPSTLTPWARINYRRDTLFGLRADGYGGAAGLRWMLGDRVEFAVSADYGNVEAHTGGGPDARFKDLTYQAALRYAVMPRWMLTVAYRDGEIEDDNGTLLAAGDDFDYRRLLFGLRWNYAAAPGETRDKDSRGDEHSGLGDGYLDLLYVFGGRSRAEPGFPDADIESGALIRGSAALVGPVFVRGSIQTLDLDENDIGGAVDEASMDWYSLGPGLGFGRRFGPGHLELFGSLSYERATVWPNALPMRVFDGAGATLGARYRIGGFEIAPAIKAFRTEASHRGDLDFEGGQYSLDLLYAVSPSVSFVLHGHFTDGNISNDSGLDVDLRRSIYGAGLRFYFGGDNSGHL